MRNLDNPGFAIAVIGVLVKQLGGSVTVTQAQLDETIGSALCEEAIEPDRIAFTYDPMTAIVPVVGGKYNWKGQPERLIYLGHVGRWHQFALVEKPHEVWCEVVDDDLVSFEQTDPST
jgi:hypothetical protein